MAVNINHTGPNKTLGTDANGLTVDGVLGGGANGSSSADAPAVGTGIEIFGTGSGGGGGGAGNIYSSSVGGFYGAGGGGARTPTGTGTISGAAGAQGAIIITYVPGGAAPAATGNMFFMFN